MRKNKQMIFSAVFCANTHCLLDRKPTNYYQSPMPDQFQNLYLSNFFTVRVTTLGLYSENDLLLHSFFQNIRVNQNFSKRNKARKKLRTIYKEATILNKHTAPLCKWTFRQRFSPKCHKCSFLAFFLAGAASGFLLPVSTSAGFF